MYNTTYLIRRVAVRIGRPVLVVLVPLPGPILKILAGGCCCALNWNAFCVGFGALNEKADCAAGAVAGPPKPNAGGLAASVVLFAALNENPVPDTKNKTY